MTQNINFTVQKGDSLWSLWEEAKKEAEKKGKKVESWNPDKIARENNLEDPNQIVPKQKVSFSIVTPEKAERISTNKPQTSPKLEQPNVFQPEQYIEVIRGGKSEWITVNRDNLTVPPTEKAVPSELRPEIEKRIKALYYSWAMDYIDLTWASDSLSEKQFFEKIKKEGIKPEDISFKEDINLQNSLLPAYVKFAYNLKVQFSDNPQRSIYPQDFMKVPLENDTNRTNIALVAKHQQNRNGLEDFTKTFKFYSNAVKQIYISMKEFMKLRG